MSFDLKLTFTGMMLYVPELTQLQVLLPKTAEVIAAPVISSNGCTTPLEDCVEPHAARITFDTAYTRPGATAMDQALAHVSLRQKRLEIPAVGSAYVRGIPSVVALATATVRSDVLAGTSDADLAARIRLSTGQATYADPGECWEYQGTVRRMSHQVEWTISGIDADWLDLPFTDLAGLATQGSLPRLYPVNGVIDLWIWHAPAFEIPPDGIAPMMPQDGDEGHHFSHLGMLLETRALERPLFRPQQCGELPPGTRPRERDRGATALSCTGTQVPVQP